MYGGVSLQSVLKVILYGNACTRLMCMYLIILSLSVPAVHMFLVCSHPTLRSGRSAASWPTRWRRTWRARACAVAHSLSSSRLPHLRRAREFVACKIQGCELHAGYGMPYKMQIFLLMLKILQYSAYSAYVLLS